MRSGQSHSGFVIRPEDREDQQRCLQAISHSGVPTLLAHASGLVVLILMLKFFIVEIDMFKKLVPSTNLISSNPYEVLSHNNT